MIHQVLPIIIEEMNTNFQRNKVFDAQVAGVNSTAKQVILANLMNQTGGLNEIEENNIICSLVNVQEEEVKPMTIKARNVVKNEPIFLNLTLVFAAYFKEYKDSLKALSEIVSFFQGRPLFTPTNTPALSGLTDRISIEIVNLDTRDLSSLWSMMGAKYLPSIIYKIKIISIDQQRISEEITTITEIEISE